ncbi:MAG: hypothetical protein AAF702_13520 [Chloroflexota bacterium]
MTDYPYLASNNNRPSIQMERRVGASEWRKYTLAILCGSAIGALTLFSPWLAIMAILGVAGLILFLTRPITLCYMLIGTIVISSGMERGAIVPLLKPNELALLLAAGITILIALAKRSVRISGSSYSWYSFLTLGVGTVLIPLISYIIRGVDLSSRDLLILAAPLQYFLLFWVFATLPRTKNQRYGLLFLMVMAGGLVAFIGLLQAANVGLVVNLLDNYYPSSHGDVASEAGRVTSLLGAWNATGIFLMAVTLLGWAILPESNSSQTRFVLIGTLCLILLGLIATGSFAGIGVLILGLALMSLLQGKGVKLLTGILFGVVVGILILVILQPILGPLIEQRLAYQFGGTQGQSGWIPQTLSFRFQVWEELFLPAIWEEPIWGIHPTIPDDFGWHAMESQYIFLLFTGGLVGLVGWLLWLVGSFIWLSQNRATQSGFANTIIVYTLVLLSVMTVAGFTNEVFTFLGTIDYLWILLALTANSSNSLEVVP